MKTIGETLKGLREKQGKTVGEIARMTQIKPVYIEAIEHNALGELPSVLATQGFVSSYAKLVGMQVTTALALLRRDFDLQADQVIPKLEFVEPARRSQQRLRLMRTMLFGVVGLCVVGLYGVWGWWKLHSPPTLVITTPTANSAVRSPVTIRGHADTDAMLEIDAVPVALDQNGDFAYQLTLGQGDHTITVIAQNRKGQQTIQQRTIHAE